MAASGQPAQQYVLLGLRALRLLRTLRLLTHRRVYIYVSHLFARLKIRASWVALVKRTVFTIVFAHCNACLQFLLAVLDGMPEDCWVVRAGIQHAPVTTQYYASIFHAVSQMPPWATALRCLCATASTSRSSPRSSSAPTSTPSSLER